MKRFRFLLMTVLFSASLLSSRAQVAVQLMHFSFLTTYGTQKTNDVAGTETFTSGNALINTANVVRAIIYDALGPERWTNWNGATLQREVDMVSGTEKIFIRRELNRMDVSSYFTSFAGNFTADLLTQFPGYANNFTPTNPAVGVIRNNGDTITTNFLRSHDFYFVALNTTNLKFNFLATGLTHNTNVVGKIDGTTYSRQLQWEETTGIGTIYFNGTTNIFGKTPNTPAIISSGTTTGSFSLGRPLFSRTAPPFGPPTEGAVERVGGLPPRE